MSSSKPDYTPHARAERLIAGARFVLAFFSLVAVYLEPSTPAKYEQTTYTLLSVYTIYALTIVAVTWTTPVPSRQWRLVSHVTDLGLFTFFIYLTEGPASPFFLYFTFSLFCATLRFTWRGIVLTGVSAMAIYGAMAILASVADPNFHDTSRVLIREVYLMVIAALLAHLGAFNERLRGELALLAAWPREMASRLDDVLRQALGHAAAIVRSRRVLLVWEEREEPWVHAALWSDGAFSLERLAPGRAGSSADEIRNVSFFAREDGSTLVYDGTRGTAREEKSDPVGEVLRVRFAIRTATGTVIESETLAVRLFALDTAGATSDDLALVHIAGRLVLAALEQFFFIQQIRLAASAEERVRISRELHDGVVQSLGGVGLQLQSIRSLVAAGSPIAERIGHVQRVLEHDQRELRALLRELRTHDPRSGAEILRDEVMRMQERFALEWGLVVEVAALPSRDIPARIAGELCRIINEALSNAARHGGATGARVELTVDDSDIRLRIADNGRGFTFQGRYEVTGVERKGETPRALTERVISLGGSLVVDSGPSGASVEASLPLAQEAMR
ncbi:MAG TPA: histidine kinase [Thermoanaerobaculia bacterium]|nr:histidine kinase [Thermoanaerobaculia bacterium]